jgi:hypothetical protein
MRLLQLALAFWYWLCRRRRRGGRPFPKWYYEYGHWIAQSELKSAAFVLDQDALLKAKVPLGSKPSEFRCSVADIEALTRLDFGATVRKATSIA